MADQLRPSAREYKKIIGNDKVKILELGIWIGANSQALYENFNIDELILIDRWYQKYEHYDFPEVKNFPQKVFDRFYNNDNVIIIRCDTLRSAQFFQDEYFDYIYLDDNHSYEHVCKELELYYPKLKKGGIYSGDNYEMAGVKKAVDEFAEKHKYKINTEPWRKSPTGTGATDWFIIK
jgi:hypothetical protein